MLGLTITISVIASLLAIGYVVWPLLYPQWSVTLSEDHPMTELLARKDGLLLAIKELEFDYHTGKLTETDFDRLNQRLRHQAMTILRRIEQSAPHTTALDAVIEDEILQLRQKPQRAKEVTDEVAEDRFCTQCGTQARQGDNFCAKCGEQVLPDV